MKAYLSLIKSVASGLVLLFFFVVVLSPSNILHLHVCHSFILSSFLLSSLSLCELQQGGSEPPSLGRLRGGGGWRGERAVGLGFRRHSQNALVQRGWSREGDL